MQISWHGQYTVKITTKEQTLILDPYSPETGLGALKTKADVIALTNPSDPTMSFTDNIQGEPIIVSTPGEYSIKGFTGHAIGWHAEDGSERSVQLWVVEGIAVLHVGSLNRPLTDTELQDLERIGADVLLLPVGGNTLTMDQAMKFMTTIEPRMVIPIHYKLPKVKEELADVKQFIKEIGANVEPVKKVIVKDNKLPQDEMVTVILEP